MRLLMFVATGALAGAAQADLFFIATEGEFVVTNRVDPVLEGNLDTAVGTQVGPFDFGTVTGEFEVTLTDPGPASGTLDLVSTAGDGILTIEFDGTVFGDDTTFSYAGNWTVLDGTGIYDGLTGSGDLSGSHFFTDADSGILTLTIQGDLVPAPATIALLGGAGLMLGRRRR